MVQAGDSNALQRTALSYVSNQVRRGDAGGVAVMDFGGVPALRLRETGADGTVYVTLIYCYDGQLRELYTEEGSGLTAADGLPILELDQLDLTVSGPLLHVTAREGASSWSTVLAPRTGVEEVAAS